MEIRPLGALDFAREDYKTAKGDVITPSKSEGFEFCTMPRMALPESGILTCIRSHAVDEALALGRSSKLHSPHIGRAVVVEGEMVPASYRLLGECFDRIIPLRHEHFGLGWQVKNAMLSYSPFEQTLFLDADCLVMRDLTEAFDLFLGKTICFVAKAEPQQESGAYLYAKISLERLMAYFQCDWWPQIVGGGHFYFEKNEKAAALFDRALAWASFPLVEPFGQESNRISDEFTLQLSLVENGCARSCTTVGFPLVLWSPWFSSNPDVFSGEIQCVDRDGKRFVDHSHCVVHFGGDHHNWVYHRERLRLGIYERLRRVVAADSRFIRILTNRRIFGLLAWIYQKAFRISGRLCRIFASRPREFASNGRSR